MEKHNVTVPQHRPDRSARRSPRRLAGAAAATGLLLALAAPSLAGTAHADGPSTAPRRAVPAADEPSAVPASPVKRAGEAKQPTGPAPARPAATEPPNASAAPVPAPASDGRSGPSAMPSGPAAAPAPADQKELAHTGSSTTNTVMGLAAGALILAGTGTVLAVRRRQQN
ncbi:LPXTG cell wall anchor domain-containing protein [Streptomyces sp. NPDC048111]|uniref:LPXTG cell wall anchor domain-containing protein n=1 Tax=Streptomyces sp. NPDC048111 TaxID=3365500 RepID=UPI0037146134